MNSHFCFVSYELNPFTPGGVGVFLRHALNDLLARGHRVSLLLGVDSETFSDIVSSSSVLFPNPHLLRFFRAPEFSRAVPFAADACPDEAMYNSLLFAAGVSHIHKDEAVDVCEFFDYCGPAYQTLVNRFLSPSDYPNRVGIRLHSTTELIVHETNAPIDRCRLLHFGMERAALTLCDYVVSPGSSFFKEHILGLYPFLAGKQVITSTPPFTPLGSVDSNAKKNNILFVGRLSKVKGADLFVRAAVELLQSGDTAAFSGDFILVGPEEHVTEGLTKNALLALIPDRHRNRFHFIGQQTHAEILDIANSTIFAVFANTIESFCYAAHEIHKSGVPLIVRDIPAFRDHFTDTADASFFNGSQEDLVRCMQALLADPPLRARLAQSGTDWRPQQSFGARYLADLSSVDPSSGGCGASVEHGLGETTVIILSDKNKHHLSVTLKSLDARCIPFILDPCSTSPVGQKFLGSHWVLKKPHSRYSTVTGLSSIPLADSLIILQAGQTLAPSYLESARRLFARANPIGYVTCAYKNHGRLIIDGLYLSPEHALLVRRGLSLGIVHRTRRGSRLAEFIDDNSPQGEVIRLLRSIRSSKVGAFLPLIGVRDETARPHYPHAYETSSALRRCSQLISPHFVGACASNIAGPDAATNAVDFGLLSLPGAWSALVQASKVDPTITLIRPCTAHPLRASNICWLTNIDCAELGPLPWSDVNVVGEWTTPQVLGGRKRGGMKGVSGWLSFFAPSNCTVSFKGNSEGGLVQIIRGGRSTLVDTYSKSETTLALRLQDPLPAFVTAEGELTSYSNSTRFHETTPTRLMQFLRRFHFFDHEIAAIHSLDRTELKELRLDDTLASRLFSYKDLLDQCECCPTNAILSALLEAATGGKLRNLVFIGHHEDFATLANSFLLQQSTATLRLVWPDSMQWDPAHAPNEIVFRWRRLLSQAPHSRITLLSSSKGICEFFRSTGVPCKPWLGVPLPETTTFFDSANNPTSPIFLVNGSASTNVLPALHAAIYQQARTKTSRTIYLEVHEHHAWQVAQDLGKSHLLTPCDNIWNLISADGPGVAISLSPNNGLMTRVIRFLEYGKWPLIAYSDQIYTADILNTLFAIAEWEDSLQVASALSNLPAIATEENKALYRHTAMAHAEAYAAQTLNLANFDMFHESCSFLTVGP
jgi:glycosyltransferase involved in cell wall biosynthesis